jgi:hypothetical protein
MVADLYYELAPELNSSLCEKKTEVTSYVYLRDTMLLS